MNQQLSYEVNAVMRLAAEPGLFVSLCTIQNPPSGQNSRGGVSGSPTNVPGLVDIPCMNAPPSILRVQAMEQRSVPEIMGRIPRHVLLNDYYPAIQSRQWAVVDGVTYDIVGVESDSQQQMTRLELQLVGV